MDIKGIEQKLAGIREGFVADGYDLLVEGAERGTVQVRIVAGPGACEDCLVPKPILVQMLKAALDEGSGVVSVEVSYPADVAG